MELSSTRVEMEMIRSDSQLLQYEYVLTPYCPLKFISACQATTRHSR